MNHVPSISVVIPLYNKRDTVERALLSVVRQTLFNFEVVVVDDGSTDGGTEVVQNLSDARIRLLRQPNRGVSAARNVGIEEAKSEIIAFLDADDEWAPGFLAGIKELTGKFPNAGVWATGYYFSSSKVGRWHPKINGLPTKKPQILENYFGIASRSDPPLWSSAVAVSRKVIREVGGFPVGVSAGEDLLTWAKLASVSEIAYDPSPLAIYHLGGWAEGIPPRPPDAIDRVGSALSELSERVTYGSKRVMLRRYVAWWHKTRASLFLRLGRGDEAAIEACKGLRFDPRCWRLYFYFLACLLPARLFIFVTGMLGTCRRVQSPLNKADQ